MPNTKTTLRYRGDKETIEKARRRKMKVVRMAHKLSKKLNREVSEAEVIRNAIDAYTPTVD